MDEAIYTLTLSEYGKGYQAGRKAAQCVAEKEAARACKHDTERLYARAMERQVTLLTYYMKRLEEQTRQQAQRIRELEEAIDQLTAHSDIERQDALRAGRDAAVSMVAKLIETGAGMYEQINTLYGDGMMLRECP